MTMFRMFTIPGKKMSRKLSRQGEIERSIIKKFRKQIWTKFTSAINEFKLIQKDDKIAVCISGGKDSMIMAKCMQELWRHGHTPFSLEFIVMNPGYNEENSEKIRQNAEILGIPVHIFKTPIFDIVDTVSDSPCYLCARMRRGYLYSKAQELGCNKIALGHHFDDVVETVILSMFYGSEYKTMLPKLKSTNFKGMELIRPLYFVREDDIISWAKYNNLDFIRCACRFTAQSEHNEENSKRLEIKEFLKQVREKNPNVDYNIYKSTCGVNLKTILGYKKDNEKHWFLDEF